jgi:hypothetical protein
MQQMDSKALLGRRIHDIRGAPIRGSLREFLGQRGDPVGDVDRISFLRGDRPQVAHVLIKAV